MAFPSVGISLCIKNDPKARVRPRVSAELCEPVSPPKSLLDDEGDEAGRSLEGCRRGCHRSWGHTECLFAVFRLNSGTEGPGKARGSQRRQEGADKPRQAGNPVSVPLGCSECIGSRDPTCRIP